MATARLRAEGLTERHAAQGKEVEQLRAAVEDERKGRIAAEQAAAVLAARLEASAELVVRAETRAELAERQADQVTQDVRKAHAEREDARNLASQAREQGARLSGQVDVLQVESKRRDAVETAQHAENERLRVELEALRARVPGDSGKGR